MTVGRLCKSRDMWTSHSRSQGGSSALGCDAPKAALNPRLLSPSLSPYPLGFRKLLQGWGLQDSRPSQHERCRHPRPPGPLSQGLLLRPRSSAHFRAKGTRAAVTARSPTLGTEVPFALLLHFFRFRYMVLKLLLRQFSTVL